MTRRGRRPGDGISASKASAPYMIISIDFGTTFSGVCWTWSKELDQVRTIKTWDDDRGSDKVPSIISYVDGDPATWGYSAEDGPTTFAWFKLLLDYEALPENIKNSARVQDVYSKLSGWSSSCKDPIQDAMKVAVDYLRFLWKHALKVILHEHGQTWAIGMACKVVITRPAIWTQKASARTQRVAEDAILPNAQDFESVTISLISEPEAAAHAVLHAPSVAQRPSHTHANDIYLICDAGGGTVLTTSEGDLCGAVFIDDEFEGFLQSEVGRRKWASLNSDLRRRIMTSQWEHGIKRQFENTVASRKWVVDIFGVDSYAFTRGQIQTVFQPTCSKARMVVRQQVDQIQALYGRSPKAIILVGGLGSSNYLSHLLRVEYSNRIEIRHSAGNETWIAVCRGAVLAMKEELVISRIARLHYGMSLEIPYDHNSDQRSMGIERVWESAEERQFVKGRMEWMVRRGTRIRQLRPSLYSGIRYFRHAEELEHGKIDFDIWVCGDREAPAWVDSTVKMLCTIRVQLLTRFEELPRYTSPSNEDYRMVKVDMIMVPNGNALDFEVYSQDQRLEKEIHWPDRENTTRSITLDEDADETRRATREHLVQAGAHSLKSTNGPSQRGSSPRHPIATTLYTPGEDDNSSIGAEYDDGTDEAESSEDEDNLDDDYGEELEPVLDGEVLQEENVILKQELSLLRDRLDHTKTELAFQQSRRPTGYDEAYFEEQLNGLRSQIRSWCASYFSNGRSYWTMPAERRFKPLCSEWADFLASRSRRPWLIQARVWYTLDHLLFNSESKKQTSWLFLGNQNSVSVDKMFAQAAEKSNPANRHTHREWRALTFSLLFPGRGRYVEPNSWLQAEFDSRVTRLRKLLWSSLRSYMDRPTSREIVTEAKFSLQEIVSAAFYFHLDMMKYIVGLSFISEDCSAGARFIGAHMEDILGGDPQENVRLMVSPPLYKDVAYDGTATTRQVLMRAQVFSSVLERRTRSPVEKTIAPVYTTRSKRHDVDSRHGRDHDMRRGKVRRRAA
ncbi:hypothetical protein DE146DRAFT_759800 [Phaeosphaeria sp. MPI-PUGE-AT-0046c]|nr:hypothetical protein DE146DRAFT_759800 [Phaeosphaeria sp. MPI-PUGE-AT-0046c]